MYMLYIQPGITYSQKLIEWRDHTQNNVVHWCTPKSYQFKPFLDLSQLKLWAFDIWAIQIHSKKPIQFTTIENSIDNITEMVIIN